MALPVAKLGTLLLRTLSKPIASRLKSQAAVHPKFRDFIISIAQVRFFPLSGISFRGQGRRRTKMLGRKVAGITPNNCSAGRGSDLIRVLGLNGLESNEKIRFCAVPIWGQALCSD
jgi:hypothetical protein